MYIIYMKNKVLEMFDHFRISSITINTQIPSQWAEWLQNPYLILHNENVKGVVISNGDYPLEGYDLSLEDHLKFYERVKEFKSKGDGLIIDWYYYDSDKN